MQTKIVYITPLNVGGHPEYFMSTRTCPICGCCNDETFLIPDMDYYCSGCKNTLTYKLSPQPIRKKKKSKLYYSYLTTRNWW